uniref:Pyruvate dehydrogenase E1 component, subunit alpha (N-terminal) n=1 Tax=Candidatus Nitrotoga fabula TaxID=2182327 RepID=A0A2X0R477_9PROT|nr:Pyruvate dehydrogenase E1 component, subunit alpha (N-terminal fragment) [Candidatus Nitrotoga fabula]
MMLSHSERARNLLHGMLRIRRFEEKSAELYSAGKIRGFLHLYVGEEAVATGVMQALRPEDAIFATYREHGHALARGLTAASIMAEMFGKPRGAREDAGVPCTCLTLRRNFTGAARSLAEDCLWRWGMRLRRKCSGVSAWWHVSLAREPLPRESFTNL